MATDAKCASNKASGRKLKAKRQAVKVMEFNKAVSVPPCYAKSMTGRKVM